MTVHDTFHETFHENTFHETFHENTKMRTSEASCPHERLKNGQQPMFMVDSRLETNLNLRELPDAETEMDVHFRHTLNQDLVY